MRKLLFTALLIAFCSSQAVYGVTVTIGTATTTSRVPFGMQYGYERYASIYTPSDIMGTGPITSLAWYVSTAKATSAATVTIRIKVTTFEPYSLPSMTWATAISGATTVYSASKAFTATGWNIFTISPFSYTINNLLVLVQVNYGGTGTLAYPLFRYHSYVSQAWYANTTPPTVNGTNIGNRPNIQITYTPTPGLWTGNVSTNWNAAANWSDGTVPTSTTDVRIPASRPNYPILNAASSCNSITIESGSLSLGAYTLNVYGNFRNNATFTSDTGTINFTGSSNSDIAGTSAISFYNMTVSKTAGVKTAFASKPLTATGSVNVSSGILEITNTTWSTVLGDFTVQAGAAFNHNVTWSVGTEGIQVAGNSAIDGTYSSTGFPMFDMTGSGAKNIRGTYPGYLCLQNGNFSASGDITCSIFIPMWAAAGTFYANGKSITVTGSLINSGGTVYVDGGSLNVATAIYIGYWSWVGAINISSGTVTCGDLNVGDVSATGTVTHSGGIVNINGNLTISTSCAYTVSNSPPINITGNLTNNGTFIAGMGKVVFTGTTGDYIIGGTAVTAFNTLEVTKTLGSLTLGQNIGFISQVDLSAAGNCGIQPGAYSMVTSPVMPGAITGSSTVCASSLGNVYSISPTGGATYYTWTTPSGASITAGQGTTSVSVTMGNTSGNMRVTSSNMYGTSEARDLAITVNSVPSAPVATAAISLNSTQITANWNAATNATAYYLDVSTNEGFSSFVSGYNNLNVGNVTSKNVTSLTYNITYYYRVRAANACGASGNSNTISANTALAVGESYQGGIIFYIDGTGQHGLIAPTSDQGTAATWGCYLTDIPGASEDVIGTGHQNTHDMIAAGCTNAAQLVHGVTINGYNDWFLPSRDELNQLCINRVAVGGFAASRYWSSTEHDSAVAFDQNFSTGNPFYNNKNATGYVRCVRAF